MNLALRLILLVYGLVLGAFAGLDLFFAEDLDIKLAGAWFGFAALVIVVGCGASFTAGSEARPRIYLLIASDVATVVVGLALVLRIRSNFVPQPLLLSSLIVTAIAILAAAALGVLDFRTARRAEPTNWNWQSPERATVVGGALGAVGALVAASLALPPFWYTTRYAPSTDVPVVTVSNDIMKVSNRDGQLEVRAAVTIENTGKTAVRVLTSLYEITGTEVEVTHSPDSDVDGKKVRDALEGNYGPAARYNTYATYHPPQQIQFGPITVDQAWLGPGEKTRATVGAHARGKLKLLRLTADVAVARADRVEVDESRTPVKRPLIDCPAPTPSSASTKIMETRRSLKHAGMLDWLTESNRELVTIWAVSGAQGDVSPWWPPFPWINASLQHKGHDCEHALTSDDDGLEQRAMVGWAGAVAEAPVPGS
ncbi:hypothetical protein [Streptomyces torulosus]|uniref:hypothetical protein n=1 Tax=Streptomyces torulosus TaxID=68276 RepID=UPI000AB8DC8C|nr:hypothetical protein [Streptomyces torulosus]